MRQFIIHKDEPLDDNDPGVYELLGEGVEFEDGVVVVHSLNNLTAIYPSFHDYLMVQGDGVGTQVKWQK